MHDEHWRRHFGQHLSVIHPFGDKVGKEASNDSCCGFFERLERRHQDNEARLSLFRNECGYAASNRSTKEEDIFLIHLEHLIDKIINSERIFLKLQIVLLIVAEEAVPRELHCQNSDTEPLTKAVKHEVAHAQVFCIRMKVEHDFARTSLFDSFDRRSRA